MSNCRPVECLNPGLMANIVVSLKQAEPQHNSDVYQHYGDKLIYTCWKD